MVEKEWTETLRVFAGWAFLAVCQFSVRAMNTSHVHGHGGTFGEGRDVM